MEKCPVCGMVYDDFRTALTFKDVRDMMWSHDDDSSTWVNKGRHGVLGKWHQIKLELWQFHLDECRAYEEFYHDKSA